MLQKINNYRFEKIASDMSKKFGSIKKGEEESYDFALFPMESNLIKVNRKYKINSGRRAIEAVRVCLFIIDGYLNDTEYDLDIYLTDKVSPYVNGLLMAFDPAANEKLLSAIESLGPDIKLNENPVEYYEVPIKCLVRIEKSIEFWTKKFGENGYFSFLEQQLGRAVPKNDQMDFIAEVRKIHQLK
jgi:hypothetical protein